MRGRTRTTAAALGMALLMSSCFGHRSADPSQIVVGHLAGAVSILPPGAKVPQSLGQGAHVDVGSTLHMTQGSQLRLLRGKTAVDLLPYQGGADVRVAAIDMLDVSSGFALVRNDPSAPLAVSSRGVAATTTAAGVFRFDRELGHERVGVYQGAVTLSASPVDQIQIRVLRQGDVSARELPNSASWYHYSATDPWDAALLGDVMQIDTELEARERGYVSQFGAKTKAVSALAKLAPPGRNVYFAAPYLAGHDSAELLVGVVFSFLVDRSGAASAESTLQQVLAARGGGATWGELARSYGVEDQLVDAVLRAIQIRTGTRAPGTELPTPTPTTTSPNTPGPSPSHRPSTRPSPHPSTSPTPKHSPSPSPTPSTSPTGSPLPTPSSSCLVVCFPGG